MGNYNPHAPYILGEEWVPIRDEDLVYSPSVNTAEIGTRFRAASDRQIRTARFYTHKPPSGVVGSECGMVNVYVAGTEDETGPISQIIIPVNSISTTGSGISVLGGGTLVEAVAAPGGSQMQFDYIGGSQRVWFFFNVDAYPVLANKRILNVSLLYQGWVTDEDPTNPGPYIDFVNPTPSTTMTVIRQMNNAGSSQTFTSVPLYGNTGVLELGASVNNAVKSPYGSAQINALNLGDINNFWDPNTAPGSTKERLPWRYVDLQRLQAGAAGSVRQFIQLQVQLPRTAGTGSTSTLPGMFLDYVALRVIYCEEKRVAYGGKLFTYLDGMNQITMRDLAQNADPILPGGADYLPTLSWVNPGQIDGGLAASGKFPQLNACRELYQIPSHPATQVDVPFPLTDHLGETFTSETTHILPQLSLHASGGVLTEPHVYGRQVAAQVYGAITATQDIYDDISGVAASYPQVRFYARRFGDTSVSLTLTGVGGLSGSTVSITPTDFDALTEIIDGWREVTLRFASPPSMGAVAGNPAWTWSAVGETAGNRWEILGASAPAISGVGGSNTTLVVPSADQLGNATYQPPATDVELTWMPQGVASPWVTGVSADAATDAVLIFSQDPPTITGVALTQLTQTVTGIGLDCGGASPCCIPSGIGYQQITWSASSLPTTGFGAYELQRWDSQASDFQTIMLATSPTTLAFNDYEARVGVTSVYRIRALNALNFAGLWSTYVSGTASSATGGCADQTGPLIFTTNAAQSGALNAAYVMQWAGGSIVEDFALPEADAVTFQLMYGRNGSVAFHGTERGLETFSRIVLIHGGAVSIPRLSNATKIRDIAWAAVPYVCVRDELGDRWFANVRVSPVSVENNRTQYLAKVDITETTQTPYAVSP